MYSTAVADAEKAQVKFELAASIVSGVASLVLFGALFLGATVAAPVTAAIGIISAVASLLLWMFPQEANKLPVPSSLQLVRKMRAGIRRYLQYHVFRLVHMRKKLLTLPLESTQIVLRNSKKLKRNKN